MRKHVLNFVLLFVASTQLVALSQDTTKPAAAKPAEKAAEKKADPKPADDKKQDEKKTEDKKADEKKTSNRLPSHYGKLNLTDAQKQKVYAVQDKHEKEIDALNEKLKAAKAKRDEEIEAVLTPDQKKALKEITSAKDDSKEKKSS